MLYWKLTDPKKYFELLTRESYKPLIEATNIALDESNIEKSLDSLFNAMPSLQQRIDAQNRMLGEAIKQKYNKQNTWQK